MVLGGASMALIAGVCLNKRSKLLHFMWVQWEYTCRRNMYFGFCRLFIIRMPFLKATWKSYSIWWVWYVTNFREPRRKRGTRRSGVMECWGGRSGVMEYWGGRSGVMECWGGRTGVMDCWGGRSGIMECWGGRSMVMECWGDRSVVMKCWGGRSGVMECWWGRSGVMECWGGRSEVIECWGGSNKLFLFLSKERSQLLML